MNEMPAEAMQDEQDITFPSNINITLLNLGQCLFGVGMGWIFFVWFCVSGIYESDEIKHMIDIQLSILG